MAYNAVPQTPEDLAGIAKSLSESATTLQKVADAMQKDGVKTLQLWMSRASDAEELLWKWSRQVEFEHGMARAMQERAAKSQRARPRR